MLTAMLTDTVLGLPLSARLALLDADPTGAGWTIGKLYAADLNESPPLGGATWHGITGGCAWLPANPLVVLSVASDIYSQTARGRDCWPHAARAIGRKWVLYLMATDANGESRAVVSAENVDSLAAAVEVLREVCRG